MITTLTKIFKVKIKEWKQKTSPVAYVKIIFLWGYFHGLLVLSYSVFKVNSKQSKLVTKQNAAATTVTVCYPVTVGFNISLKRKMLTLGC